MYPHQKLDWAATRLEARLAEAPDDVDARLELARNCLSRALWHGGGEAVAAQSLQHARKLLADEPGHPEATVLAGAALVGMERPEAAQKYLDEAMRIDPERADLHLALGAMYRALGDRHLAIRHLEQACRLDSESWEVHLLLGRALAERARQVGGHRLSERSQYHLVQALKREPPPELLAPLMRDLGLSCLRNGRYADAEKLFIRLRQNPRYSTVARRYLGQVAFALGKYKSAIQHDRQYLEALAAAGGGDDAPVLAQIGMAYLHLGELERARECCNKALLVDPDLLAARHALGCTLVEEGHVVDALRIFKDTLHDHPEHMATYVELARTRRRMGDAAWLQKALAAEVGNYDRLPLLGGEAAARTITRKRIAVLLEELRAVGPSSVPVVLSCLELAEDEALRFTLWEAACAMAASHVADEVAVRLREPGRHFAVPLARNALAAAAWLPEPALTAGLDVSIEDIQKAAVERHGNAPDIGTHRRHVDAEREVARAWQAVLLLAVASRKSRSARQLLASWGRDIDPDLHVAVLAALVMCGDPEAGRTLVRRAQERGATPLVDRLLGFVGPASRRADPRPVDDGEDVHCSACGRKTGDVTHLMSGTSAVVCDLCMTEIARNRRTIAAPDDASCALCGRTSLEAKGVYRHHGIDVCASCVELSMGLLERDEVDRFLAAW